MATGREWKSEKWWIALPIATRTIDRYTDTPLDCADRAPGHRQGPYILAPGPGSGGGNRPPRRQADPGAPPLPRGAPKGRHNCHFQPAAGESDSESGSRLRFLQKRPRGEQSISPAGRCLEAEFSAELGQFAVCSCDVRGGTGANWLMMLLRRRRSYRSAS